MLAYKKIKPWDGYNWNFDIYLVKGARWERPVGPLPPLRNEKSREIKKNRVASLTTYTRRLAPTGKKTCGRPYV